MTRDELRKLAVELRAVGSAPSQMPTWRIRQAAFDAAEALDQIADGEAVDVDSDRFLDEVDRFHQSGGR